MEIDSSFIGLIHFFFFLTKVGGKALSGNESFGSILSGSTRGISDVGIDRQKSGAIKEGCEKK